MEVDEESSHSNVPDGYTNDNENGEDSNASNTNSNLDAAETPAASQQNENENQSTSRPSSIPPATPISCATNIAASAATPRFTNDQKINQDYKLWKKNIPILYDCLCMSASQFPSQTVDWVNEVDNVETDDGLMYQVQKIATGTLALSDNDAYLNGIVISNVKFPHIDRENGFAKVDDKNPDFKPNVGLFTSSPNIVTVHGIIPQPCPITVVRVMPNRPNIVCAKLVDNSIVIYDWKTECEGWNYEDDIVPKAPLLELLGHDRNLSATYGLAWNPSKQKESLVASCAKEGKIFVWDIDARKKDDLLDPFLTIAGHDTEVDHIAWHPLFPTILGSAGIDKSFCLFDIRSRDLSKPSHKVENAHEGPINAISFASTRTLLATASDDATVGLWDMRNLKEKLHSMKFHVGEIFTVDWCREPESWSFLATGGADRRVCVWDISKIGDKVEGLPAGVIVPPELAFVHGGHSGRVTDLNWNLHPGRRRLIASVAEDAITQIWTPAAYQVFRRAMTSETSSSVSEPVVPDKVVTATA